MLAEPSPVAPTTLAQVSSTPNEDATSAAPDMASLDALLTAWKARELTRVVRAGVTYVDFTGAALYPESLVRTDAARLERELLGNPHSQHAPSRAATCDVEAARRAILDFLHADASEYAVILTANASAACRVVAESFPFAPGGALLLAADNHNSVNGMREYAHARGASTFLVGLDAELRFDGANDELQRVHRGPSLFAFPAQSNFSGVRHPLSLLPAARDLGWLTFLDAASFLPTSELRLDVYHPDFVALSLYKIAGYPTGIGALVARHEALATLRRPSFAGGTVDWVSVERPRHRLLRWPEGFEDGTPSFLAAGAVQAALFAAREIPIATLGSHLDDLTLRVLNAADGLRHQSGVPLVVIHGPRDLTSRGATIAFSLRDASDRVIPYWEVEENARDAGIAMRGGCFCNPGCAERAFSLPIETTQECFDTLGDHFSIPALAQCLGESGVGALRVSLGLGSVRRDVDRVVEFLGRYLDRGA